MRLSLEGNPIYSWHVLFAQGFGAGFCGLPACPEFSIPGIPLSQRRARCPLVRARQQKHIWRGERHRCRLLSTFAAVITVTVDLSTRCDTFIQSLEVTTKTARRCPTDVNRWTLCGASGQCKLLGLALRCLRRRCLQIGLACYSRGQVELRGRGGGHSRDFDSEGSALS